MSKILTYIQKSRRPELVSGSQGHPPIRSRIKCGMTKMAFTLAEVLITLGIIGVVAAMTIPTLMNKTNDAELKNKLKKEVSVFSQAILQIAADNDGDFVSGLSSMSNNAGTPADSILWRDLFATKIKTIKTCDLGVGSSLTYGGCFGSSYKYYVSAVDPMTNEIYIDTTVRASAVAVDGATYSVFSYRGNCSYTQGTVKNACGSLNIDVNGAQKPNKFGKDMFNLLITSNGLSYDDNYGDDCGGGAGSGYGAYCSYKVMQGINY